MIWFIGMIGSMENRQAYNADRTQRHAHTHAHRQKSNVAFNRSMHSQVHSPHQKGSKVNTKGIN